MNAVRNLLCVSCLVVGTASASVPFESGAPSDTASMAGGSHHGPGADEFHDLLGQLNLSADQKQQVQSIFAQARPQMHSLRETSRTNREQLVATPPTDANYPGLVAQAKTNAAQLIQLTSDLWTQVYAVLTPEQQAKIPDIVAAARSVRDAHRAHWRQPTGQ